MRGNSICKTLQSDVDKVLKRISAVDISITAKKAPPQFEQLISAKCHRSVQYYFNGGKLNLATNGPTRTFRSSFVLPEPP